MALSFEESKKLLAQRSATPFAAPVSMGNAGIMTLETGDESGEIAAYSEWIVSDKYIYNDQYADDGTPSRVDGDKNVTVPSSQVNLTQEENSQYIPFEMPRYYDGFDLMSTRLSIHYLTSDGYHGSSDPINVSYDTATIKFGWLVDGGATHIAGVLKFEIRAIGVNANGNPYVWKSKTFDKMTVLQSLIDDRSIVLDGSWVQELVTKVAESVADQIADLQVGAQVDAAENAATRAETAADEATSAAETAVTNALANYSTTTEMETYVAGAIADADIKGKLTDYAKTDDVRTLIGDIGESKDVVGYVNAAVANVDVKEQLKDYALKSEIPTNYLTAIPDEYVTDEELNQKGYLTEHQSLKGYATETFVQEKIDTIPEVDLSDYVKSADVYTKSEVDNKLTNLSDYATHSDVDNKINANNTSINSAITAIRTELESIDKSPNAQYITTYNQPFIFNEEEHTGENMLVLYEIYNKDTENETRSVVSAHEIKGGTGGVVSTSKVERITKTPIMKSLNDSVKIAYRFINDDTGIGYATWKIGNKTIINKETIYAGDLEMDLTDYIGVGSNQKVTLSVTDDSNAILPDTVWYVTVISLELDADSFDDTDWTPVGQPVEFTFTPKGDIDKTIHFYLDGQPIGEKTSKKAATGLSDSYTIPAMNSPGAHLLEAYMTAVVGQDTITSNREIKDIIWYDEESAEIVIGCAKQQFTARQYEKIDIDYTVYDSTNTPNVTLRATYVDAKTGETVEEYNENVQMESNTETWPYKSDVYFDPEDEDNIITDANILNKHTLTITCGSTVKTLIATITESGINIQPVTTGLAFDFNPSRWSNGNVDKTAEEVVAWTDGVVSMRVSQNFDWVNGGYQPDEDGNWCFCVKAGDTATIDYQLFKGDPKESGKEFKVVFKTENVSKRDESFISCMGNERGLDMKIEDATVTFSDGKLQSLYCEDAIIEYEFNIKAYNFDKPVANTIPIVMSYEDGTPSTPSFYNSGSLFNHSQPITIGSPYCDVRIYRMKVYNKELTDKDIVNNFIADARNIDDMVARYNRNQIYDNDGQIIATDQIGGFSIDALMKAAPDLRFIMLECPQFTNDKDNKIDDCTVYHRYPKGRPEDNWTCTNMRHRGQGTSSNDYGYSGRNIDLCMDRSNSLFTWVDENGQTVESKTITLTEKSVPTDYLNIKVNIASSENTNNAEMARRFNDYQPFKRYAKRKDSRVRDTMEFYNCVVFIRETSDNITQIENAAVGVPHREFADKNWHFYGIGNIGDSKKTDDTRVNNPHDPKECVVEIADVDLPLASFPVIEKWEPGDRVYDLLYSKYTYDEEDGSFKTFGAQTYEFRYEMDGITEDQRKENIETWRELYKFITMSTDTQFQEHLKDYFVVDTALYYYLFTERYTMVDNRAKNSFWHYGKVYISNDDVATLGETEASYYIIDDDAAEINEGYRWDLTFGYDFDTCLGIDNVGKWAFTYGKEDIDYANDGSPVFRAHDSTFFCRIRDLFKDELGIMFRDRDKEDAWSGDSLINQWDDAQSQFPEELWRKDFERKYWRTYLGSSVDNSFTGATDDRFLKDKFLGRKKYQRRGFETNQDMYFSTKYYGRTATSDENRAYIRGKSAPPGSTIAADYTLKITPYSNMYVGVKYGSSDAVPPKNIRATAGVEYTFTTDTSKEGQPNTVVVDLDVTVMDFVYMYGASYIQAIDNLSTWYVEDNNFAPATRLKKLVLGSDKPTYYNSYMKRVGIGNNKLLEYLDLSNISGINTALDLRGCGNLKQLYAQGTNATGVTFANRGMLQEAYLPQITSLSMRNLGGITDENFVVEGYNNLQSLTIENTPYINSYDIVNNAPKLASLNLLGLDWSLDDCSVLDRLLADNDYDGEPDIKSELTGVVHIDEIKQYDKLDYEKAWKYLYIDVPDSGIIQQYPVAFYNADKTPLRNADGTPMIQYVTVNKTATDPSKYDAEGKPTFPTIASDVEYDYIFARKWAVYYPSTGEIGNVFDFTTEIRTNMNLIAVYTPVRRTYKITYKTKVPAETKTFTGLYGENISYDFAQYGTPYYDGAEQANTFYLFSHWDKSGLLLDDEYGTNLLKTGEKVVNAVYDIFHYDENVSGLTEQNEDIIKDGSYTIGNFKGLELSNLSPVHIYALTKLGIGKVDIGQLQDDGTYKGLRPKDSLTIQFGNDFDYIDARGEVIIGTPMEFTGSNYYDTGIKLLSEDRDFVLAIDCKMSQTSREGVLAQCFSGFDTTGFRLSYNSGARFDWGSDLNKTFAVNRREMIVIRHRAGETGAHIYMSNLADDAPYYVELNDERKMETDCPLVFGANKITADGTNYDTYGKGFVYWSKLWYTDLGDDACRKLASWPHEKIGFEVCCEQGEENTLKYYYIDRNTVSSITFIASNVLSQPMPLHDDASNSGGWATYVLNTYLNNRVYKAFPDKWRQLIKPVQVTSSIGDKSITTSTSACSVFIPSISELGINTNTPPYSTEGTLISHLAVQSQRVCKTSDGAAVPYWTRSPSTGNSNPWPYVYSIKTDGSAQPVTVPTDMYTYVRLMISI